MILYSSLYPLYTFFFFWQVHCRLLNCPPPEGRIRIENGVSGQSIDIIRLKFLNPMHFFYFFPRYGMI